MYCECSTRPLVTDAVKRIGWFLIVMCAVSCSATLAAVTVVEGPTEGPFEGVTPFGEVDLWLALSQPDPDILVNEVSYGNIKDYPLSGSALNGNASLDGEVGLWYAEGNVDLGSDVLETTFGRSTATALAHFTIDGSQLSLHWDFSATTAYPDPVNVLFWHVIVQDHESGDLLCWYSQANASAEGTETLDLVPDRVYRLYWGVDVGVNVWDEYGGAVLTLDLQDLGGGGGGNDKIVETMDFFDGSVEAGELEGQGPAQSADKRLNALRNMLENAAVLIEGGFYQEACDQLWDAYGKCDGDSKPPDLVAGDAAADLAQMILEVIDGLGCE